MALFDLKEMINVELKELQRKSVVFFNSIVLTVAISYFTYYDKEMILTMI